MFGFSFSEILLVGIIFALVMTSGRIVKIGETIAVMASGKKPDRPSDDARIGVREGDDEKR